MQHTMSQPLIGTLLFIILATYNAHGMDSKPGRKRPERPLPIVTTRALTPVAETHELVDDDEITSPRVASGAATPGAGWAGWRALRVTWIALANRGVRHVIDTTPLEDRYLTRLGQYVDTDLLCGVFDGHLGHRAAEIAAEKIPASLPPQLVGEPLTPFHVESALGRSFLTAEDAIHEYDGGTTATVAYIWPSMKRQKLVVSVANTGDSRTLVCDLAGNILLETRDHKATDPEEETRITDAGGLVFGRRLSGCIELSRSLGDLEQKQERSGYATGLIALPETYSHTMEHTCFILQATDGLWDHASSRHAAITVAAALAPIKEREAQLEEAARQLYHHACSGAAAPRDDTTILLTLLEPATD